MKQPVGKRILMLLENNRYPQDIRVQREAQTLTRAGFHVTVICPAGPDQPWNERVEGVRVCRFPPPPDAKGVVGYLWEYGYSMVAMFVLSLYVFVRYGFDTVHAHNPPDMLALIAGFYKLLGRRFVFDHHDLWPEMLHARFGRHANRFLHRALLRFERFSFRIADHVIATNESYRRIARQRGDVPESRISVVRNGPDLGLFRPDEAETGSCPASPIRLCYVGLMGFHDGVDYLMRALDQLVTKLGRRDFHCTLVGRGDAVSHLKTMSETLRLTDYVTFTGPVPHRDVAGYLHAADICLAPEPSDPYNDQSTMIKIMEYMAMAKPTVAFDLPEHRVTGQDAIAYARPNDEHDFAVKIADLMDDPDRRHRLGAIGRSRVEAELAWHYQAEKLLSAYDTLGSRRSSEVPRPSSGAGADTRMWPNLEKNG